MWKSVTGQQRALCVVRIIKWYVRRASSLDLRNRWELQFFGIDRDVP